MISGRIGKRIRPATVRGLAPLSLYSDGPKRSVFRSVRVTALLSFMSFLVVSYPKNRVYEPYKMINSESHETLSDCHCKCKRRKNELHHNMKDTIKVLLPHMQRETIIWSTLFLLGQSSIFLIPSL